MNEPVERPSVAMNVSVRSLNRYGSRKTTRASGAPLRGVRPVARRADGPSGLVHDLLHQAAQVAIALGVVERAKLGGRDAVVLVRLEDAARLQAVSWQFGRRRHALR